MIKNLNQLRRTLREGTQLEILDAQTGWLDCKVDL